MILAGIDIGKDSHFFSLVRKEDGEVLAQPRKFANTSEGFKTLTDSFIPYDKESILIGMEDTGHYHFALLRYLLSRKFNVALINPTATDFTRKANGSISKNDRLDTLTICDVLSSNKPKKPYRISKFSSFDLYEQRGLTRHHHNLKEEINVYTNRLQKCIDIVFPEYNSLFSSKYSKVYNNVLKTYGSAANICEVIQIRHLIEQIELLNKQIKEIDKKIEEYSLANDSPILSIPGISHFSGTSILAELGDINNYNKAAQIIKRAGVAPLVYESSKYQAKHTAITKSGSKYLRKTLYQIILPVIRYNPVFQKYYDLKISQGKSHRCACGHCVRKLLRIIFHLLKTNQKFDPALLR